jgi:hypothetical protein
VQIDICGVPLSRQPSGHLQVEVVLSDVHLALMLLHPVRLRFLPFCDLPLEAVPLL